MFHPFSFQIELPLQAIVFDCDSTLSHIEGIDELAREKGVYAEVSAITSRSMNTAGLTPAVYAERLNLIQPTDRALSDLSKHYLTHLAPGAREVIEVFKRFKKSIYIISGGFTQAVQPFSKALGIVDENIFSVALFFDAEGRYTHFDNTSPLVYQDGKKQILLKLRQKQPRMAFVGDGSTDCAAKSIATRFIGYGGCVYRPYVAERADFYIKMPSLFPLLPLCLTNTEYRDLTQLEKQFYKQGLSAIQFSV